ncbi:MAG: outer membrane beta-barrel protein [Bacteroidetes bacterium]|nr:outer membrane beta-barrel protein [Bacteroidota bacterium]
MKKLSLIALLSGALQSEAQNSVEGKIIDKKREAVPYCPIALLNSADSSIAKGTITNENGKFVFENIKPNSYLIKINYTGYTDTLFSIGTIDTLRKVNLQAITLKESSVNLNEVSVTVMKKPMEFKNGNIIVNIDGSPMAIGNTVYDLLMRLPGVIVTDGVISIQGKSGVKVLIDDRVQQLSGIQLMAVLKSMSANSILKIEILKNPPVKYDAAGNAGIINIVTKKINITGFSGSANFSNQQGFYDIQAGGITLNYKAKKVTFFSGINIYNNGQRNVNHKERAITYNGNTTIVDEISYTHEKGPSANIFIGADWFVNEKNTIGVRVEDIPGNDQSVRYGSSAISDNSLGYSQLNFQSKIPNYWNYVYTNINAEHRFDTLGTKLKFNGDIYSPYNDEYPGSFQNNYITGALAPIPPTDFKNSNTIRLNTFIGRLDFEKKIFKTISFETGLKGTFDNMSSSYILQNLNNISGAYITDTNFTNTFTYKDQILAGYINAQRQIKKFNLQAGLRAENTSIQTLSISKGIAYTRQYFYLFPNASISYSKNDKHTFQFAFNRRIDRPDYNNFNPYRQFNGNILSYGIGNPFLYPSLTSNIELSHNYKGVVGGSVSYARTTNFMMGYATQNDTTKVAVGKIGNLQLFETFALSSFFQKDIAKWWSLSISATGYFFKFTGVLNNVDYTRSAPSGYANMSNTIIFPKGIKAEISGVYIAPWLSGANAISSRWAANFAIKKSMFNDKLNLSVGINDMFFTLGIRNTMYVPGQTFKVNYTFDSRRYVVGLIYTFGKIKIEKREIKGNDEDKKRLGH